jgi:tRNA/rRNA methyltransferase
VFGPENNGLNNHDISLIDKIVTIPTSPDFSSLNLAQSVVVVLYEIFKLSVCNVRLDEHRQISRATNQETIGLFEHLESELLSRNFFKVIEKRDGMIKNIRSIFKRIENLSSQDVSTLRGIIKNLSSRN